MDWYDPTYLTMEKVFNNISRGGVLIVDDYGHHPPVKKAVEQWLLENNRVLNFHHINYSCVVANV